MPEEANSPIERELESYARQRRAAAGGPFELHPATRRRLQNEVARTLGRGGRGAPIQGGWWDRLKPRFVWLGPALAVVVVGAVVWWSAVEQPRRETQDTQVERLARLVQPGPPIENEPLTEAVESATDLARTITSARPPWGDQGRDAARSPDLSAPGEVPVPTPQAAAPARLGDTTPLFARDEPRSGAAARTGESKEAEQLTLAGRDTSAGQLARAANDRKQATGAPPSDASLAAAPSARLIPPQAKPSPALPGRAGQGEAAIQSALLFLNTAATPNALAVLHSFQVEQTGEQLRIIDADGSTYQGRLVESAGAAVVEASETAKLTQKRENRAPESRSPTPRARAGPAATANPSGATYHFIAEGTNRSLQQRVVFQGEYQLGTTLAPAAPTAPPPLNFDSNRGRQDTRSPGGTTGEGASGGLAAPVPARLQGRAVVGGTTTIEINAVPSTKPAPGQE